MMFLSTSLNRFIFNIILNAGEYSKKTAFSQMLEDYHDSQLLSLYNIKFRTLASRLGILRFSYGIPLVKSKNTTNVGGVFSELPDVHSFRIHFTETDDKYELVFNG